MDRSSPELRQVRYNLHLYRGLCSPGSRQNASTDVRRQAHRCIPDLIEESFDFTDFMSYGNTHCWQNNEQTTAAPQSSLPRQAGGCSLTIYCRVNIIQGMAHREASNCVDFQMNHSGVTKRHNRHLLLPTDLQIFKLRCFIRIQLITR